MDSSIHKEIDKNIRKYLRELQKYSDSLAPSSALHVSAEKYLGQVLKPLGFEEGAPLEDLTNSLHSISCSLRKEAQQIHARNAARDDVFQYVNIQLKMGNGLHVPFNETLSLALYVGNLVKEPEELTPDTMSDLISVYSSSEDKPSVYIQEKNFLKEVEARGFFGLSIQSLQNIIDYTNLAELALKCKFKTLPQPIMRYRNCTFRKWDSVRRPIVTACSSGLENIRVSFDNIRKRDEETLK